MTAAWYDDRRNLAAVARHMGVQGDAVEDVAYMLEKPQKFEAEWLAVAKQCATCSGRGVWMDEPCGDCQPLSREAKRAANRREQVPEWARPKLKRAHRDA